MKRAWTFILFTFISGLIWGQTVADFKITPSNPTVDDSITVDFKVVFLNTGAQKQNGSFTIGNDSILYTGCYFKPVLNQGYSEVRDTIYLGKLPAGHYDLLLFQNIVFSVFDTSCINVAYSDTVDTFFVVSVPNAILPTSSDLFQVVVLAPDRLKIFSDAATKTSVNVFDALGRLCFTQPDISLPAGINQVDLTIPNLPKGVYFYDVRLEKDRRVSKYILH